MKKMDHLGVLQECSSFKNKKQHQCSILETCQQVSIHLTRVNVQMKAYRAWGAIPQKGFICLPLPHCLTHAALTSASREQPGSNL